MSMHCRVRAGLVLSAAVTLAAVLALAAPVLASSPGPSAGLPPTDCATGVALPSGSIATIAGTGTPGFSGDGGPAVAADLRSQSGTITLDPSGALYFGDTASGSVRRIGPDGIIDTVATGFEFPLGVAIDAAGDVYLANHVQLLMRIDASGAVTTEAGSVAGSSGNDGPAGLAQVNPTQVAVGPNGDLYFDDTNSYRTIDPAGIIHAFAGTGTAGFSGDGGPAVQATFSEEVDGIAADTSGNVYLGDPGNHRIRQVDPAGIITTMAGTGESGSSGDGGPATAAAIDSPAAITVDPTGNVYFSDDASNTVRRIDPKGTIATIAGTGTAGFSGDCGPASAAQLSLPAGLAVRDGVLYILDSGNNRIRVVVP